MNELTIFKNENFGEVRTLTINEEPYFCLADVCRILELENSSQVKKRLNPKGVILNDTLTTGGNQKLNFINEANLYKAIFQSKTLLASDFQNWICEDVVPSIRKSGIYATKEMITKILNDPDCIIEILLKLKSLQNRCQTLELSNKQNQQLICELQPKATYYDLILQNKNIMPITKIAKDYGMSGQTFNSLLHDLGVQYRMGDCWLLYQKYAHQGYTQSKTHVVDAEKSVMRTQWTPKGRLFIYDLLKNKRNLLPMIERTENLDGDENE